MERLSELWPALEATAAEHGVIAIGATTLDDPSAPRFAEWLERGFGGSMQYLHRHAAVRLDPAARYPWARSVIAIAVPYPASRPSIGVAAHIARYAQGDDYHEVLGTILKQLEATVRSAAPEATTWRYVDTGPLSERSMATRAGLGWIGRNGMLIGERHGSWHFIGLLLTSLLCDIVADEVSDRCGSCTRCLDACPTDAILPDRLIDSNRCISHATIEERGAMPDEVKEKLGDNLFGCDICQEVCPWNRFAPDSHPALTSRESYGATPVSDLLRMNQAAFSTLFARSAIKRARRSGMLRNAIVMSEVSEESAQTLAAEESDAGVLDALQWRNNRPR